MNNRFETPILFLVFNRPDTTQQVFNKIKEIKPRYLFVAADGPRSGKPGEDEKCLETRNIIKQIDWDCELKTLFRENNLGCGVAVSDAITWFFNNVEEGIILEDDCLPSQSFFEFCQIMLKYYRQDNRIWHIAGYNSQDGKMRGDADYFFSQETPIWGWATWRRVWEHYKLNLDTLKDLEKSNLKSHIKKSFQHSITAMFDFRKVFDGKINTWDYQYSFYQLVNNGLSIIPNINLVKNIGFNISATHTSMRKASIANNQALEHDFEKIKHPLFIIPDKYADAYTYNKRTRLVKKIYVYFWYYLSGIFH